LLSVGLIAAGSVVGIWINVDFYVKPIASVFSLVAVFLGVWHVSKLSVPRAFAVNYFKSLVVPINTALTTSGARIEYKDQSGSNAVLHPEQDNVGFEIVLPKDMTTGKGNGLDSIQDSVNEASREAKVYLSADEEKRLGRKGPYTMRIVATTTPRTSTLVDVPNNLNALRYLLYSGQPGAAPQDQSRQRKKRAERALEEYVEELHTLRDEDYRGFEKVKFRGEASPQASSTLLDNRNSQGQA